MSRRPAILRLIGANLPLWLLGVLFAGIGALLAGIGLNQALNDWTWMQARTTTGRVMLTEWKRAKDESRLIVIYGYKDDLGAIYHNTAILARKLGKINLEPATPVVVLYRSDDHSKSRMQLELGSGEWIPILVIGSFEIIAGAVFLTVAARRLLGALSESSELPLGPEKTGSSSER